ncbi:MAG TPA: alpha/beta hydrolase [Candidatus Eremiobacteraceae bacterium]|nr:alpha/beta hydrolase [Candidatus Eremiobacteraceae bacterium]
MTDRAAAAVAARLAVGEELIWAGAPNTGSLTLAHKFIAALFALAWTIYLIYVIYEARSTGDSIAGYLLFPLMVLATSIGATLRRNTRFFGVTDRRAIVVQGLRDRHGNSAPFEFVEKVDVTDRNRGTGTVTFIPRRIPKSARYLETAVDASPMTGPVVFDDVEDADKVVSLVNGMLERQKKQDWDAALAALPSTTAKSGDLKIAYADAGSGDPIVFLHGVGATKKCWAMQVRSLSRKYRCIALDYRGYGDSDIPPPGSISRETFALDVAAVMDTTEIEKAVLCGNSLGGAVALEFYKQFPKRVKALVLVDSFAYYPGGAESISDRLKTLDDLGIEKFAETRSPALFRPDAPSWLIEAARADLASIPLDVYKAATSVTWSGDYRRLLPKIDVRALVVWGEHDTKIAPRVLSKELALNIPASSDLSVILGAGHIPQMEAPRAFNSVLTEFLS